MESSRGCCVYWWWCAARLVWAFALINPSLTTIRIVLPQYKPLSRKIACPNHFISLCIGILLSLAIQNFAGVTDPEILPPESELRVKRFNSFHIFYSPTQIKKLSYPEISFTWIYWRKVSIKEKGKKTSDYNFKNLKKEFHFDFISQLIGKNEYESLGFGKRQPGKSRQMFVLDATHNISIILVSAFSLQQTPHLVRIYHPSMIM